METREERQASYVQGLRDLADFFEADPDLIPRYLGAHIVISPETTIADESPIDAFVRVAGKLGDDVRQETPMHAFGHYAAVKRFGPHEVRVILSVKELMEPVEFPDHPLAAPHSTKAES